MICRENRVTEQTVRWLYVTACLLGRREFRFPDRDSKSLKRSINGKSLFEKYICRVRSTD